MGALRGGKINSGQRCGAPFFCVRLSLESGQSLGNILGQEVKQWARMKSFHHSHDHHFVNGIFNFQYGLVKPFHVVLQALCFLLVNSEEILSCVGSLNLEETLALNTLSMDDGSVYLIKASTITGVPAPASDGGGVPRRVSLYRQDPYGYEAWPSHPHVEGRDIDTRGETQRDKDGSRGALEISAGFSSSSYIKLSVINTYVMCKVDRLAFHFKRATASGPPPPTLFPVAEEAKAVDSIEKTNAGTMKKTSGTWNGRNWLGSFFATKIGFDERQSIQGNWPCQSDK
ncbi:hypothetical protein Acr_00g0052990 [Actinidia rufa]|uniref:Uncharacterized protein n=1 Tax=Actinidia rufa TaxID=165716 RepID=A0A7J0DL86_9ERIC|nr:hypothetical protein Acr_00g0052990 [Actinidia rufa]